MCGIWEDGLLFQGSLWDYCVGDFKQEMLLEPLQIKGLWAEKTPACFSGLEKSERDKHAQDLQVGLECLINRPFTPFTENGAVTPLYLS